MPSTLLVRANEAVGSSPDLPDSQRFESDSDPFSDLAAGLRDADPRALEALFRTLHPALVRYATTLVDGESAEDLVQEAFVRLWEGRASVDPTRSVKALLFRSVRNLALNRVRDQSNRRSLLDARAVELRPRASDPESEVVGRDLARRLHGWIDALPQRQREALNLSRFEGLSHGEVAEVMGLSARTVNNHLVRALRTIRERIESYEPSLLES